MNDEYIIPYKFEYIDKINIKDGTAGLRVCVFIILNDLVKRVLDRGYISLLSPQQCRRVLISLDPCQYSTSSNVLIFADQS